MSTTTETTTYEYDGEGLLIRQTVVLETNPDPEPIPRRSVVVNEQHLHYPEPKAV